MYFSNSLLHFPQKADIILQTPGKRLKPKNEEAICSPTLSTEPYLNCSVQQGFKKNIQSSQ